LREEIKAKESTPDVSSMKAENDRLAAKSEEFKRAKALKEEKKRQEAEKGIGMEKEEVRISAEKLKAENDEMEAKLKRLR